MINPNNLHTVLMQTPLKIGSTTVGTASIRYEIRQVVDVSNLGSVMRYRILCTHRVTAVNTNGFNPTPGAVTQYADYPALLTLTSNLDAGGSLGTLVDYQPRTLNTAVMTSANQSNDSNQSYSQQHTYGSSTSQTNSYDVNVNLGFFGDMPTGGAGGGFSHSKTKSTEQSDSAGNEHGTSIGHGTSESISIKDWGSYAYLDGSRTTPSWVWSQEYPWDVLQFRDCPSDNNVDLPDFVMARLFDNITTPTMVYPPSHLSQFGVDFIMKATWQVDLSPTLSDQIVTLTHDIGLLNGTHGINGTGDQATPFVRLDAVPSGQVTSPQLDLTLLGLVPLDSEDGGNGAVIGFSGGKFQVPPSDGSEFKILSASNNLQVMGTGFDQGMSTDFSNGAVTLKVQFKVIDDICEYNLFLKHWKTTDIGLTLTIVINGNIAKMDRHVDDLEGEGGANNLLVLNLRNGDYSSIDYHDYLVMGLNTIDITITPDDPGDAGYLLRALAVGEI